MKSNRKIIELDRSITGDLSVMLHRLLNAQAYGMKTPKSFIVLSAPFDLSVNNVKYYPARKVGIY